MRIVIGVDDSPHSRAALDFVGGMKWPSGSQVIVLAVAKPAAVAHTLVGAGSLGYMRSFEEEQLQAQQELAARAEREMQEAGFETTARVLTGDPREAIVETARAERADLIVVGSHGRTGLDKLLMGSVASHVVTHAPCSVMVVKLGAKKAKS
jgi:nucleotide-binding universal stress UspA family protein